MVSENSCSHMICGKDVSHVYIKLHLIPSFRWVLLVPIVVALPTSQDAARRTARCQSCDSPGGGDWKGCRRPGPRDWGLWGDSGESESFPDYRIALPFMSDVSVLRLLPTPSQLRFEKKDLLNSR